MVKQLRWLQEPLGLPYVPALAHHVPICHPSFMHLNTGLSMPTRLSIGGALRRMRHRMAPLQLDYRFNAHHFLLLRASRLPHDNLDQKLHAK